MNFLQNYSMVIYPAYSYVTIDCNVEYFNDNFDKMLKVIGKHYWADDSIGTDKICSLIKDKINHDWKLNGFKKSVQKKRVSTNQVKAIRRSFQRICNHKKKIIRIPFHSVSIIFFILDMLHRIPIGELSADERRYVDALANSFQTVGETFFQFHTALFNNDYKNFLFHIDDLELIDLYNTLYANLNDRSSVMRCRYDLIAWNRLNQYIIK